MTTKAARVLPTGICWCGCDTEVPRGSFFAAGHDKVAESAVIMVRYGGVPEFLSEHGYGPGGRNARRELETWRRRGKVR